MRLSERRIGPVDQGDEFLHNHFLDRSAIAAHAAVGKDDQDGREHALFNAFGDPAGESGRVGAFRSAGAVEKVNDRIFPRRIIVRWLPDNVTDVPAQGGAV